MELAGCELQILAVDNLKAVPGEKRRSSVAVSPSAWHAVVRGSFPGPGMLYFRCKNLALDIAYCVSLVGRGSSVVGASLRNYPCGSNNLIDVFYIVLYLVYYVSGDNLHQKISQQKELFAEEVCAFSVNLPVFLALFKQI